MQEVFVLRAHRRWRETLTQWAITILGCGMALAICIPGVARLIDALFPPPLGPSPWKGRNPWKDLQ